MQVIGFHGRLGADQTPARRAAIYAGPTIDEDVWLTTGTRVQPPWTAKSGTAHVLVIGEREELLVPALLTSAGLDTPPRVLAFLRWVVTGSERCDELCCARVEGLIAWCTSADEDRALCSLIAGVVRVRVVERLRQASPNLRELRQLSFWLSRAAVDDADMFLAVAGLREAGHPEWRAVLRAGVRAGDDETQLREVEEALSRSRC